MTDTEPEDCIFCAIERDEAPASVVYEDDTVFVIADRYPVNPGHSLVIPREHGAGLADVDEETGGHCFRVAQRVAAAVRASGIDPDGINLFLADGEAAFQEVFHLHLHVLPRFEDDAFDLTFERATPDRERLDEVAAEIREGLDRA